MCLRKAGGLEKGALVNKLLRLDIEVFANLIDRIGRRSQRTQELLVHLPISSRSEEAILRMPSVFDIRD